MAATLETTRIPTRSTAGSTAGKDTAAGYGPDVTAPSPPPLRLDPAVAVESRRLSGVSHIAVLRANALGDLVFALPALESLRAAYPSAHLTLVGKAWHRQLLAGRPTADGSAPLVDEVVVAPPSQGVAEPGPGESEDETRLADFFAEQQARGYDLALQLHGGGRYSNPFVRRLGARVSAGLRAEDAPPLDRYVPYVYYQSEVDRLLEVVALVGAPPVQLAPALAVTDADRRSCEAALPELTGRPLAVLHPGASDVRRRWPVDRFAAVADSLSEAGAEVVITGGASEAPLAEQVQAASRRSPLSATGRLSLPALVGLLARASVVVSNDTGPLHAAAAVGTPTVGIYWAGNLINAGPVTRARHRPQLSWRTTCPVCGWDITRDDTDGDLPQPVTAISCPHAVTFVDRVGTEAVITAALDLLQQASPAEAAVA